MKVFSAIVTALSLGVISGTAFAQSAGVEAWQNGLDTASNTASYACDGRFSDDVNNRINNLVPNVCAQLDNSVDFENHPHRYESPQATCDLGLNLPGLPSFNGIDFNVSGPDACGVVKNIVGDSVKKLTGTYMDAHDAINDTLNLSYDQDIEID